MPIHHITTLHTNLFSIIGDSDTRQQQANHVEPVHVSGTKPLHMDDDYGDDDDDDDDDDEDEER